MITIIAIFIIITVIIVTIIATLICSCSGAVCVFWLVVRLSQAQGTRAEGPDWGNIRDMLGFYGVIWDHGKQNGNLMGCILYRV